jgi:phage-related protein
MALWDLIYYPVEGERNSPIDSFKELCDPSSQAEFQLKFRNLREFEYTDWQFKWLKQVRGFFQVKQGNFRAYFRLNKKVIVVLHYCRKVSQKAKDDDIRIAEANWKKYEREMK